MEAVQRLQALDFVLVIVWVGVIGWGLQSGLVRQLIFVVAVYAAAIVAAQLYRQVGALLAYGFGPDTLPQDRFVAYALVFTLAVVVVMALSWRAYPHTRLENRRRLDAILGAIVGSVAGALLLIVIVTLLRFYAATTWHGHEATQREVDSQVRQSQLAPMLQVVLSPLWQAMVPWFPDQVSPTLPR